MSATYLLTGHVPTADPDEWPCPDGALCKNTRCVEIRRRYVEERRAGETIGQWVLRANVATA